MIEYTLCKERDPRWPEGVYCILMENHTPNKTPSGPHVPSVCFAQNYPIVTK